MGIADRREREKEQRRNTILDAAERLFFSKGIAQTTMDEVAEATELAKGTVYLYFKSKDELFWAILGRAIDLLAQMVHDAHQRAECGLGRIYFMGKAFYDFHLQHPEYFAILFHREPVAMDLDDNNPALKMIMEKGDGMFTLVVEAMNQGKADGSIRPDVQSESCAMALHGMFTGLIRVVGLEKEHLMKCHQLSPEQVIGAAFDLIGNALANPGHQERCKQPICPGQTPLQISPPVATEPNAHAVPPSQTNRHKE